jgi:hypothetical protein
MRETLLRRSIPVVVLGALLAILPAKAQAAPTITSFTCTQGIQQVVWDGGGLYIDCIGEPNRFVAYSFNGCSGVIGNMDNVKIFEALASAAFMSGRTLILTYATPGTCVSGIGVITAVTLSR